MTDDDKDLRAHMESLIRLCEKAQLFSKEIDRTKFFEDEIPQMAISFLIGQFGEVSRRVLRKFPEFAEKHPELPFVLAKG